MRLRGIVVIVGLMALILLSVACGNGEAATTPGKATEEPSAPAAPVSAAAPGAVAVAPAAPQPSTQLPKGPSQQAMEEPSGPSAAVAPVVGGPTYAGSPLVQAVSSQVGIWVTGEGTLSLEPDLALVNIGVETEAATVTEARNEAATAMAAIVAAVKAQGLEDRDIQTRSFNIFPRYDFVERRQVFVGYVVSNAATIKVRDLDKVGSIIDDVANAGGDATRINGISFTVEDTKPFMTQLREAAVNDALGKAQHYADLTGVALGRLVYLAETGGGAPRPQDFGATREFAMAAAAPVVETSISGGELELRLTVRVVFDIQ